MKKLLIFCIALILVSIPAFASCGEGKETGGIMKCVAGSIPANLGYTPEKAPVDDFFMLPVIERLAEWDENGNMVPVLATSWDVDANAKTITWHLREGVKFHDGTDWNAEALRWNFQLGIDTNSLTDGQYVESLEVVNDQTLKMHLNTFSWMMIENYGLIPVISPTAYMNSGTTDEERIAWARMNAVGTGAFTVSDFKRDDYIKFVKNPDYWQEGLPYLDGIEIRYIPDPVVAAATLEAGEADIWLGTNSVENIVDLQDKGMKINWGPGMFVTLLPNSSNPDCPLANKKVREAIEYAINRPAIAEMLGQGLYEPLHQMASSTWPGYVEGYDPRPYNPDRAMELLEEAGYTGLTITLLAFSIDTDPVAAIQADLADVGITIEPDMADPGRYFGAVFFTGWDELVLTASGINPSTTDLFIHYGPNPMTFTTGTFYKSPEYLALCAEALDPMYENVAEALPKIKEAIRQAGEDAMLIPLWRTAEACIMHSYVHSDYLLIHGIMWSPEDDWMEEH